MKITKDNFVAQISCGNEKALHFVIEEYGWLIQAVVRRNLASLPNYEEECINDVLLAVWQHIDSFHPEQGEFSNWVAGVARYKAIDYKRKYLIQSVQQIFDDDEYAVPYPSLD
ncbi:MAG: sigma factor, partial [Lachnospiraceae bacterium]|nr:sigma factor [Lachnospiraceae bacterium]